MKNWKKYLIIGGIIILAVVLFFVIPNNKKSEIVLATSTVGKGEITMTVTATGTVEPITLVEVGTQVSGTISKIYVDFNSEVKAGEVLAELDKRLLDSELETAVATMQSRKAELELQEKTYARYQGLWEKQAVSKADWEAVETAYQTAKLAVTSSQAAVLKAQTNLGYATIYSTIDGVVISRAVEEGQTVAASFSTPTLFTIANDLTKMRVIANVDEADIGSVIEGQRVMFTVDAYPNDEFQGKVVQVRLEATTESNVVTYEVVIDAPNPDLKLKPGLTANVNIYIMEESGVLVIPTRALRFSPDSDVFKSMKDIEIEPLEISGTPPAGNPNQRIVWVKSGNVIDPREIVIGVTDNINYEVKSGLNEGDVIVTGVTQRSEVQEGNGGGETNPFMPQRPGGNRRR